MNQEPRRLATLLDAARELPPPETAQKKPGELSPDDDTCPLCGGFTFVRQPRPLGHPDFGKLTPCYACLTAKPVPTVQGLTGDLVNATFASFDISRNRTMLKALQRCQQVADRDAELALLAGDIGCGKTHLAVAALNASAWPKPGVFFTVTDFLLALRRQMFDKEGAHIEEGDAVLFYQSNPGLVVIDDLGTEKATDWSRQTLFAVLDARSKNHLPTILTTNDIGAIDERLLSRFYQGTIVCEGKDIRRTAGGAK